MYGITDTEKLDRRQRVIYVECIGGNTAETVLRALGLPDCPQFPRWFKAPDGTPVTVVRLGWLGTVVYGHPDGSLLHLEGSEPG